MKRTLASLSLSLVGFAFACGGSLATTADGGTDGGAGSSSGISNGSSSGPSSSSSGGSGSGSGSSGSTCSVYTGPSSCPSGTLACDGTQCCPANRPFYCPSTARCYTNPATALAACPASCEYCSFSGSSSGGIVDSGVVETGVACTGGGVIGVIGVDGGDNTACEQNIASSCGNEQCLCTTDTNMFSDDAGSYPSCAVYVLCVYQGLAVALQTSDAGPAADLANAQAACAGMFPPASVTMGDNLYSCIAGNQATLAACLP